MQRKPLPNPPKNNPQINEYTGAVKRGLQGYYVTPSDNGWNVRKASVNKSSANFSTKAAAITYAKNSVSAQADIVVHDRDGTVIVMQAKSSPRSK
jgi:hypothetical protein